MRTSMMLAPLAMLALGSGVARADRPTLQLETGWNIGEGRVLEASRLETGGDFGIGVRWHGVSVLATGQIDTYVATATGPGVRAYGVGWRARYTWVLSERLLAPGSEVMAERSWYFDAGTGEQFLRPDGSPDAQRANVVVGTGLLFALKDRGPHSVRIGWYVGMVATFARALPAIETADTVAVRVGPPATASDQERSYLLTFGWRFL